MSTPLLERWIPTRTLWRLARVLEHGDTSHKHPSSSKAFWETQSVKDHVAHAFTHLNFHEKGDTSEPHLHNACVRLMFAIELSEREKQSLESKIKSTDPTLFDR